MEISLTGDNLEIRFAESDTGYIASMPLYGYLKTPQKGQEEVSFFGPKARDIKTWQWQESLPEEVIERCNFWCRTFLSHCIRRLRQNLTTRKWAGADLRGAVRLI